MSAAKSQVRPAVVEEPVLVIGDIHHHTVEAELVIARHSGRFRTVVFLGDYFDDFGDTPERMQSTCRWLKESLQHPDRIHLLGNHDLSFLNPSNTQLGCPGWSVAKQHVFDRECSDVARDRLFLAVEVSAWVLSHAGFHHALIGGLRPNELVCAANDGLRKVLKGDHSPFVGCGYGRGGRDPFGGVTWLDWNTEFEPIAGLNQIVGHTPAPGLVRGQHLSSALEQYRSEIRAASAHEFRELHPVPGDAWISVNWCIDTQQAIAALIDGNDCQFV